MSPAANGYSTTDYSNISVALLGRGSMSSSDSVHLPMYPFERSTILDITSVNATKAIKVTIPYTAINNQLGTFVLDETTLPPLDGHFANSSFVIDADFIKDYVTFKDIDTFRNQLEEFKSDVLSFLGSAQQSILHTGKFEATSIFLNETPGQDPNNSGNVPLALSSAKEIFGKGLGSFVFNDVNQTLRNLLNNGYNDRGVDDYDIEIGFKPGDILYVHEVQPSSSLPDTDGNVSPVLEEGLQMRFESASFDGAGATDVSVPNIVSGPRGLRRGPATVEGGVGPLLSGPVKPNKGEADNFEPTELAKASGIAGVSYFVPFLICLVDDGSYEERVANIKAARSAEVTQDAAGEEAAAAETAQETLAAQQEKIREVAVNVAAVIAQNTATKEAHDNLKIYLNANVAAEEVTIKISTVAKLLQGQFSELFEAAALIVSGAAVLDEAGEQLAVQLAVKMIELYMLYEGSPADLVPSIKSGVTVTSAGEFFRNGDLLPLEDMLVLIEGSVGVLTEGLNALLSGGDVQSVATSVASVAQGAGSADSAAGD